MLFNSFDFLVFFAIVFAVQLWLPHRPRNLWLLLASCFFYACWDWRCLGLMFVTIVTDYSVSHAIAGSTDRRRQRQLVALSCCVNLGILGFFKYFNFFVDSAQAGLSTLGVTAELWSWRILLPVGISFYTFQSMSYTIDVFRGHMKPLQRFTDYALYVTLFPQLVAGPIERGTHLAAQVTRRPPFSWQDIQSGSWLVVKGLFKKAVIADNLAPLVDGVFSQSAPGGLEVLVAVYAFAFQIYGDFSGYSDIARGTGRMMGYDLMLNFRLPYFATDPSDFWRRWHISLSTWLRDYLYIPLGGNRRNVAMTCRNLMLTMALGGLWHGAAWPFVVWGIYHGVLLIGHRLLFVREDSGPPASRGNVTGAVWLSQVVLMFHLTCYGWLIFRAESVNQIWDMTASLLTPWSLSSNTMKDIWQLALVAAPLLMMEFVEERTKNLQLVSGMSWLPRTCIYAATIAAILAFGQFGGQEFIYFQF